MAITSAAFTAESDPGLNRSCVVEASAGTGKTTALVDRIVEVIAAGTPVETIVAVTFTHAAAGNMKLRVRHELEQRRAGELDPAVRARLAEAARSLDRAFIGTIHAFCAQLLRRRPVEAGVDPVFQELAQPDALRIFAGVFRRWIEQRLAAPSPALVRALARLAWREERDGAEPLDALREAAWSLAEWRDFDAPWDKRDFDRDAGLTPHPEGRGHARSAQSLLASPAMPLYDGLRPLAEFLERVERARAAGQLRRQRGGKRSRSACRTKCAGSSTGYGKYGDGVAREAVVAAWEDLRAAIEEFGRQRRRRSRRAPARRVVGSGGPLPAAQAPGRAARFHGPAARGARPAPARWRARRIAAATTSASSSTNFRIPTRCRPRSCCCSPPPIRPSATGAKPSPRPANFTWWATPSNPSTASAAPTRASSAASAATSPPPA